MNLGLYASTSLNFAQPYDNRNINSPRQGHGDIRSHYTQSLEPSPTPTDHSRTTSGMRVKNIWKDFFQVREGNCVTVSAIKAAMVKFGHHPADIFDTFKSTREGIEVTMKDGVKTAITHAELEMARASAGFAGRGKVLQHAIVLYALSAKRAQNEDNDYSAHQGYEAALRTLNDGESPGEALGRLGLINHMRKGDVQALKNGAIGTLATAHHSVAVIDGFIDLWGVKLPLANSGWEKAPHAWLLV
ncbi:hypothetical protein ASE80_19255 [Pseudomonas sp. Leaf15]|uniref:hypothetical protein n=1 Tax=unclassified Pseudomonas TaxID=196821 RepID=UPI0007033461|nr:MULTISPECIES: hypothetical protein [unclassified Pseudomonas]KQM55402.1 hypothetical protein ASE80_19255 [Pseudomonas sp. Leaf15]RAH01017.1 hypothetical protein DJ480_20455 [Pseudomonas sp. Leaf98]